MYNSSDSCHGNVKNNSTNLLTIISYVRFRDSLQSDDRYSINELIIARGLNYFVVAFSVFVFISFII